MMIVKMIEHVQGDVPPFDKVETDLTRRLEIEKKNKVAREFIDAIFKNACIEYNQPGLELLVKPDSLLKPQDFEEWVLKKYKSKVVRVKTMRPAVKKLYDFYGFDPKVLVERELQPDLLYDEAIRRRLDRTADFQKKMQDALSELLSQKYYDQQILGLAPAVDSAEVFGYYTAHKAELKKTFKEAYADINMLLYQQKIEAKKIETLNQLRSKYPVEVFEKTLEKLAGTKKEAK